MPRASVALSKTKLPARLTATASPVESSIHMVRGHKVILDADLAALYEVPTKRLNEAVKRNPGRFPPSFLFQLTEKEAESLRSQFATSNVSQRRGGRRYRPFAFTEHGVVMLSAVLNSERAIQMSILVVSAFVRMRELIAVNQGVTTRVEKLERGQARTVSVIEALIGDIDRLAGEIQKMKALPVPPKRKFGFR